MIVKPKSYNNLKLEWTLPLTEKRTEVKRALPVLDSKLSTELRHNESVRYSTESADMSGMKRQHMGYLCIRGAGQLEAHHQGAEEGTTIIKKNKIKNPPQTSAP